MAILKCKMCGGDLNITADEKIIECEFCGTTQTIPDGNDEKKTNLFNRANRLRMDNEFDKAAGVYESIVSEFPEEAEGYWGLVLCSYGIEYVDDAKTGKKIPTCHRTLTSSVMDNDNFIQACENADVVARGVYREEAKAIDKLQQQIIAVVENEEPYDVFICYKETDDITKSRTEDSLIAQDIYTELIKEGYKVFFSRVTLRDKAGTEYEPYIYAALKSAKIMLAIGTKFDYYDAVWVKNEWSRYISMMADDSSKHLIPCFKNLDAYDIPKEFKNLQALDMGEVTFFKNLTDNVERFIPKQTTEQLKVVEIQSDANSATIDSLLKRAFMFLEDGDWKSAEEYCEKVLDINPECAEAYLGKLMKNLRIGKQEDLKNVEKPFDINKNYQKAVCFADEKLKNELEGYIKLINERIAENEKEEKYTKALSCMKSLEDLPDALEILNELSDYKNVNELKEKIYLEIVSLIDVKKDYYRAISLLDEIGDIKNKEELKKKCSEKINLIAQVDEEYSQKFKPVIEPYCVKNLQTYVSAGESYTIGLKSDGTVIATGYQEKIKDIQGWKNIVAISAGNSHFAGLKSDGTVVVTGFNDHGQYDVQDWTDIVAISAGAIHTVGLKKDGSVINKASNELYKCDTQNWKNIVAISAGTNHTVGLKSDGTVVVCGANLYGECNVQDWTEIVAISAGSFHTIALRSDGTVVATGFNGHGQCDVQDWTEIVAISGGEEHSVALKSDGTVIATKYIGESNYGQCDTQKWSDIIAISAGFYHTVGLKSDGTVVAVGSNGYGECDSFKLTDIMIPISFDTMEEFFLKREKISQEKRYKKQQEQYRNAGVCQYCGGELKGLFIKKCVKCGKKKDY